RSRVFAVYRFASGIAGGIPGTVAGIDAASRIAGERREHAVVFAGGGWGNRDRGADGGRRGRRGAGQRGEIAGNRVSRRTFDRENGEGRRSGGVRFSAGVSGADGFEVQFQRFENKFAV